MTNRAGELGINVKLTANNSALTQSFFRVGLVMQKLQFAHRLYGPQKMSANFFLFANDCVVLGDNWRSIKSKQRICKRKSPI